MSGSLTSAGATSVAPDQTLLAGDIDGVALGVLIFFFAVITIGGFYAAKWRKPTTWIPSTSGGSVAEASARS